MKLEIVVAASLTGAVTFLAQIATGGFNLGYQVQSMRSEIKLIRKDLAVQNQLVEYRLERLEEKKK
jgi:hypothetical protein